MKTATPAMARAINDRLALDLLLSHGPLSAPQLRALTGLSRPTVSDLIERLRAGALIEVTGESGEDRRGPNARLYGIVAGRAYVAGVEIRHTALHVRVTDIAGEVRDRRTVPIPEDWTPSATGTRIKRGLLDDARDCGPRPEGKALSALIARSVEQTAGGRTLDTVVIGAPGLVDPATGDLLTDNDVRGWYPGLLSDVRLSLGVPVVLENNVNLAAVAEQRTGAARGRDDFVLLWLEEGVGAAVVLDGKVRRGASGGAGEIGLLEVQGEVFCHRVETDEQEKLAARIAQGVFAVVTILDPGLVVLGGATARAGGEPLAAAVAERLRAMSLAPTQVVATEVTDNAVLEGAVLTALDLTRDRVFSQPLTPRR